MVEVWIAFFERVVKYGKDSAYTPRYSMARGSGRFPPTKALTLDNNNAALEDNFFVALPATTDGETKKYSKRFSQSMDRRIP